MAFNPYERPRLRRFPEWDIAVDVLEAMKDSPLPKEAPLFFHLTHWAARSFNIDVLGYNSEEFAKFLERALAFVDSLTSPQNITQLQNRKWALFEAISGTRPFQTISPEQRDWYRRLSEILGLFPSHRELERLIQGDNPQIVWQEYEVLDLIKDRPPGEKILTFESAVALAAELRERSCRVGLTIGKYRLGHSHQEYARSLRAAKDFLGPPGVLLVGVESKASIEGRLRLIEDKPIEETMTLDDLERLNQVAELPADFVFLVDPTFGGSIDMRGVNLKEYFFQVWLKILPKFYFMGYANHELHPVFAEYARRLAVFLLYNEEEERISTTELLKQFREAA